MLGIDQTTLIIMVLAAVAVGGVAYTFLFKSIETEKRTDERLKSIGGTGKTVKTASGKTKKVDEAARRKQREESLKTLDNQRSSSKDAKNPPLGVRLKQAGMSISPKNFILVSIVLGVAGLVVGFVMGLPWYFPIAFAFVAGFGAPQFWVNRKRAKRIKAFLKEFAGSIDVIVRGIRSGLPLNDCIRIISRDAQEPVRSEFAQIVESQQVGLTMPEACQRMAERVPCAETNFFTIVITIQSQAGGNLGEALGNLSNTLRERSKMSDKIAALSMEAKASAYIIGSLPVMVATLVHLSSPDYLKPLYMHPTGHTVLVFCAASMFCGSMVMKKMINFDF